MMKNTKEVVYKKGDVIYVNLGDENKMGSEQKGRRPCVIIQNNMGNRFSPMLIVAPITKQSKTKIPTHVTLSDEYGMKAESKVLCEQILSVSKERCDYEKVCSLNKDDMRNVNRALAVSLNIA